MIELQIDGKQVSVASGATVLEAATQAGINIPTLCHHADLKPVGSCRICLVHVEGMRTWQAACTLQAREGMCVNTATKEIEAERKSLLEWLVTEYPGGSAILRSEHNEFSKLALAYGVDCEATTAMRLPVDSDSNPFIRVDLNRCILCTRCVRACQEVQGRFVWDVCDRGPETRVICGNDVEMLAAGCESCGACAAYCPTGALEDRQHLLAGIVDRRVQTTCGYCGVGCQFDMEVKQEKVVSVRSTPAAPVNGMSLCVKGRYGHSFIHHADRILRPRIRRYLLDGVPSSKRPADRGPWVEVSWTQAIQVVSERLAGVLRESGGDACGVLASAKCTNEENYLMQKFARQILRTNNIDHCARLCHSSTVAGLAMAMGSGAMSNSMDDIAQCAKAVFIIGSNTTEQHPVFGAMLRQAALRGTTIVVADPRRIDMTEFASQHLRHRPGTDVALINGILHLAIEKAWFDQEYVARRCEGFNDVVEVVAKYTPKYVEDITGVPAAELYRAAEILCKTKPMAVIWSMGITQHTSGVNNVLSLANLQMVLGNMGVAGGGVNPLRGQNNVQGACDMGALPNVYSGYQSVVDHEIADRFGAFWQLSGELPPLSRKPGLTVTEMIDESYSGDLRALYVLGEDPIMTEPDSNHARECLEALELLVLQEILASETSKYADVLLPGASFAEKSGTFTNTERRVQPVRKAIEPLGDARPDWWITSRLARSLCHELGSTAIGIYSGWEYGCADDVLAEINAVTPSYAGITADRLQRGDRLQWPVPDPQHQGTPILHVGEFSRGLGRLHPVEHQSAAEETDREFPLLLTTGRCLYHWHGGELTRRVPSLLEVVPDPLVEVSPEDAAKYQLDEGEWFTVVSRRGQLRARARITSRVAPGILFANFHFPGEGNANNLTNPALDPVAKIPEYKVCSVRIGQPVRPVGASR